MHKLQAESQASTSICKVFSLEFVCAALSGTGVSCGH